MIPTKRFLEHEERTKTALASIRQGDKVKIVNCLEAERNEGKIFEVLTKPYERYGTWCVYLEKKGAFDIACIEKVEVSE